MEMNSMGDEGSGVDNQEVIETLSGVAMKWIHEMSRRVEDMREGGDCVCPGGYIDVEKAGGHVGSAGAAKVEKLWVQAWIGGLGL